MIIFIDDLEDYGYTTAALEEGGESVDRRAEVEAAYLDRIRATLNVSLTAGH